MGHLVNPNMFRMGLKGSGVTWVGKWFHSDQRKALSLTFSFNDYLIVNYIYVFFKSLKKKSRSVVFTNFSKKIQKKLDTLKFQKRVWFVHYVVLRQSLVISHIKIIRFLDYLRVGIFFFDSTLVSKLRAYIKKKVFFTFFDLSVFKEERRKLIRTLSKESRRYLGKKKRRRKRHLIKLLRSGDFRTIGFLYPSYFDERNISRASWVNFYRKNSFHRKKINRRLINNFSVLRHNSRSFSNIFRSLVWYVLVYRKYFLEKRIYSSEFYNTLTNFFFYKYHFSFFRRSSIFFKLSTRGLSDSVISFVYNKFFGLFRFKFRDLIVKRLFVLVSLLKKFANSLYSHVLELSLNSEGSVQYANSLTNYEYYFSLFSFLYKDLSVNSFIGTQEFSRCFYFQRSSFRRLVKLRKWTQLFLISKWRRLVYSIKQRRFRRYYKKVARRFSFFKLFRFVEQPKDSFTFIKSSWGRRARVPYFFHKTNRKKYRIGVFFSRYYFRRFLWSYRFNYDNVRFNNRYLFRNNRHSRVNFSSRNFAKKNIGNVSYMSNILPKVKYGNKKLRKNMFYINYYQNKFLCDFNKNIADDKLQLHASKRLQKHLRRNPRVGYGYGVWFKGLLGNICSDVKFSFMWGSLRKHIKFVKNYNLFKLKKYLGYRKKYSTMLVNRVRDWVGYRIYRIVLKRYIYFCRRVRFLKRAGFMFLLKKCRYLFNRGKFFSNYRLNLRNIPTRVYSYRTIFLVGVGYFTGLVSMFKLLFLVFVRKVDWFLTRFVRKFYYKLFLYTCVRLLSFLYKYERLQNKKHAFFKSSVRFGNAISFIIRLLILLQKQRFLLRYRQMKYRFLYAVRFHLFLLYSIIFKTSDIFRKDVAEKVEFSFIALNQRCLTSGVVISYICKLLRNRYPIRFITRQVLRDLKRHAKYFLGFRIVCAGRVTKKQRAFFKVYSKGSIISSSILSTVDFAMDFVVLRFGVVNLKVWLSRSKYFVPCFYKIRYHFFNKCGFIL